MRNKGVAIIILSSFVFVGLPVVEEDRRDNDNQSPYSAYSRKAGRLKNNNQLGTNLSKTQTQIYLRKHGKVK